MSRTAIDLSVVFIYLIAITVIGIIVGKKHSKSNEGYFLGDREFSWMLIGFSLFATNISIGFFTGWTGKAMTAGFAAMNPELLGGFMLTVSAIIFIPIYIKTRIFTIPQFLELRYNKTAKLLYGGIEVGRQIFGFPLGMFIASSAILGLFGFEITVSSIMMASFCIACTVGIYTVLGGLTSVVFTDMIQVIIMLLAAVSITAIGLIKVGGMTALHSELGPTHFELLRPASDLEFPWTAIPGQSLHSAFFAFCSIAILQRALGAKTVEDAQKGLLFAGFLKLFGFALFIIPGLVAVQLYTDINPDIAYVTMVRDFLAPGLSGIVLAAMVAALMSSQDSGVNATASLIAMDVYPAFVKNPDPKFALKLGKVVAATIISASILVAPVFLFTEQGIFNLIMKIASFMILPTGLCYIFGRFMPRANSYGAVVTMVIGMCLGVYYIIFSNFFPQYLPFFMRDDYTHFYVVFFGMSVFLSIILVVVSLLTPAPEAEKLAFLIHKGDRQKVKSEKPWYQKFYFWWCVYAFIFAALYVIF